MYADKFHLWKNIKRSCEIKKVQPVYRDVCSEEILNWKVTYKENDKEQTETFDFVVVSTGFYTVPFIPSHLKNVLKDFNGTVTHSLNYKDWRPFENKRVLVCGLGSSGGKEMI